MDTWELNINLYLTAVYRELDVRSYQGLNYYVEKEWKSLDTKTCCKILHIDQNVLEGLIKGKNAYEVSVLLSRSKRSLANIFFQVAKLLYFSVQKQSQLWLVRNREVCPDLELIHESFLRLCLYVGKAGIKISDVHLDEEQDLDCVDSCHAEALEKFQKLSDKIINEFSEKETQESQEVNPDPEHKDSLVIQVEGIKISQDMVTEVQIFLKSRKKKCEVIDLEENNLKIAEDRRKCQRRKSQVYEAILQARKSNSIEDSYSNLSDVDWTNKLGGQLFGYQTSLI